MENRFINFEMQALNTIAKYARTGTNFVKNFIVDNYQVLLLFFIASVLHYAAAILYVGWCTPPTIIGFLLSPFRTITPMCVGLRWSISVFGDYLSSLWTFAFLFISSHIIKWFGKTE